MRNKNIKFLLSLSFSFILVISCVKKDYYGKSAEKKILDFSIEGQIGNAQINEDSKTINVSVNNSASMKELKPTAVRLSTFAQIFPSIEARLDFSEPVKYTVTAEDGSASVYEVIVFREGSEPQLENSHFNDWYTSPKGYKEIGANENSIWASGNAGSSTIGDANVTPFAITEGDFAAQLTTLDLGQLAGLIGQRMAAGSLFTGKFELDVANPLNSTKFGIQFSAEPKSFSFKYAYQPGSPYLSKTGQVLTKTDSCDIYVLLENKENNTTKRVATGWYRSGTIEIDKFKSMEIPLHYGILPAITPSYQLPVNGAYAAPNDKITHITVVFSSSYNGALFEGGTNSTLLINDFKLIY